MNNMTIAEKKFDQWLRNTICYSDIELGLIKPFGSLYTTFDYHTKDGRFFRAVKEKNGDIVLYVMKYNINRYVDSCANYLSDIVSNMINQINIFDLTADDIGSFVQWVNDGDYNNNINNTGLTYERFTYFIMPDDEFDEHFITIVSTNTDECETNTDEIDKIKNVTEILENISNLCIKLADELTDLKKWV